MLPTKEIVKLAREAVKSTLTPERHKRCRCREEIDAGEWDKGHKVRACIAMAALLTPTNQEAE